MTKLHESSAPAVLRYVLWVLLASVLFTILWLPAHGAYLIIRRGSSRPKLPLIIENGDDALQHFAGSKDCGILQSNIYLAPIPLYPKHSPFCKNRATLLEALSNGGRHGFNEPYVGKDCTYRWFPTAEICMILERFNAVVFLGDEITRAIYTAFNILLREDLALGGLRDGTISELNHKNCRCENQFLNNECLVYTIKSRDEVKIAGGDRKGNSYICQRIPHAYIPFATTPASPTAINLFKELTYNKPNPWQPTPLIFSFNTGSFDVFNTSRFVDEWLALAFNAERNTPMLFLGLHALGLSNPEDTPNRDSVAWEFHEQMKDLVKEQHAEVLGLWNLTMQAGNNGGFGFGESVALVEAMMIINWLSKLETS